MTSADTIRRFTYFTSPATGRQYWIGSDGLAVREEDDADYDEGPTCSICDALGHGYPGGRPCPLEDRGWDDDPRGN